MPNFLVRFYATRSLPALKDALISNRFRTEDGEAIRPILFSHGLSSAKCFYSGFCHKMAANGYLVIAMNHQDGSCFYTIDKDGKDRYFEGGEFFDAELRKR